jgi:hypothetical protein
MLLEPFNNECRSSEILVQKQKGFPLDQLRKAAGMTAI